MRTKFYKPAPRPSLIARPHLIDHLNEGLGHGAEGFSARLTLVSAPAGFGKTTLMATWLAQLESCIPGAASAWLALDEGDNDPVRFLFYLVAALQTVAPDSGATALLALRSPEPATTEAVLTALINDISRQTLPIILVLDDYHLITAPAVHQALTYLLRHLSPLLHLLIATRSDPPLPLSRWRARHQMVEVRTDDLRFTSDEVRLFFSQVWGLSLSGDEIAALERRTEGWVTGLQLAALSMKDRRDQAERIAAFTGSHHFVIDYLTDEVLDRQPDVVREFLLMTSILRRLCAPLADALTGAKTGQQMLETLEHENLFLTRLDEERRWYRYHHLFAGMLQARLKQTQPEQLRLLHRRAADWFASQNMFEEAVQHALAAGDAEMAADLIEGVAGGMLHQGANTSLSRWLAALPDTIFATRPRLCLARGWTFVWGAALDQEGAEEWVQRAQQAMQEAQLSETWLRGELAALKAMIAATWKDPSRTIEVALEALMHLPADSPWRGVMNFCLGGAYYARGDLAVASDVLQQVLKVDPSAGVPYIQLISASLLAEIHALQGHLSRALELYQQVLAKTDMGFAQKGAVMARGGLANILYERDEIDAALAHLEAGAMQLAQVGGIWPPLFIYRALVRLRQGQHRWQEAKEDLERAEQSAVKAGKDEIVMEMAALRARLHLAQGDLSAAEAWAAQSGPGLEAISAAHIGWKDVAYLTLARIAAGQKRYADALALLEQLVQAAQAEARYGSLITILVQQALVYQAQGKLTAALASLQQALALGEAEGYCRTFVDEGPPMASLLQQAQQRGIFVNYAARLLGAFAAEDVTSFAGNSLPESLSERELEVLRLAASGASNKEIAGALFIALPTVKKHIGHILVKLDVHNRVQAIARGRELGLIL